MSDVLRKLHEMSKDGVVSRDTIRKIKQKELLEKVRKQKEKNNYNINMKINKGR